MKKSIISILTIMAVMLVGMNVQATNTWTGAIDNFWSTAGNWTAGVPGDGDIQIDADDTEGVINVDIAPTLDRIVFTTNVVTDFSLSGSTLSFSPGANPANTNSNWEIINNNAPNSVHTIDNDITMVDDAVVNRIIIDGGDGGVVLNGAVTVLANEQFEPRGEVTFNGALTANAVRPAGLVTLSGSGTALGAIAFVNSAAHLVVNTPADTALSSNGKIQHNSDAIVTLNSANVIRDDTYINVNGKTVQYEFNADETLTALLDTKGGTFNLVLGASVNTVAFLNPVSKTWGGSMHITGFRPNAIQFGTTSNALTEVQLLSITAEGQTGGATLDANGYLDFAGEPPLITGETIVNFEGGSSTNSRAADIQTDTGYTWNFSETEPLFPQTTGQNRTIYGGVMTTWTPATNYMPQIALSNNVIYAKVEPEAGVKNWDTTLKGMYVWSKEEFLQGANGTYGFTNGNAMALTVGTSWGGEQVRFAVKQGGTNYISDANQGGSGTLLIDPADTNVTWAPINTADYTIGSYEVMDFTDIEAVGIYFDYTRPANNTHMTIADFQVRGNFEAPPLTEISDVSSSVENGQMIVSWQGTNVATYALQMRTDLVLGDGWSNVVENISGLDDIMSVTNATDEEPAAFFRTILQ